MQITRVYGRAYFPRSALEAALNEAARVLGEELKPVRLEVEAARGTTWGHDSIYEFFADYDRRPVRASAFWTGPPPGSVHVSFAYHADSFSSLVVDAPTRADVERIVAAFQRTSPIPEPPPAPPLQPPTPPPTVFIGHGRATDWRDLHDHLTRHQGYTVEAYETGARAGHDIRARQNVVHEAGLFQGRLGFDRAVIVAKRGVETFTNSDGIQRIEYTAEIRETFGDVVATLKRELGN